MAARSERDCAHQKEIFFPAGYNWIYAPILILSRHVAGTQKKNVPATVMCQENHTITNWRLILKPPGEAI